MLLNLSLLDHPRLRGDRIIARCPACAETGRDGRCEHLIIFDSGNGPYRCIQDSEGSGSDHSKRIHSLIGLTALPANRPHVRQVQPSRSWKQTAPALNRIKLRPLTFTEVHQIAALRNWSHFAGLELLGKRGLLHYGDVYDDGREYPSWIITDSCRRNAQARRLDGKMWSGIGGAKAKTLYGSQASWPIGAANIGDRPLVILTEGGPDFCCALLFAWSESAPTELIAPVTMTGAGSKIHDDALPFFRGKYVRILEHLDSIGESAAQRWAQQLWHAKAAHVDGVRFNAVALKNGKTAKDLSDFATLLIEDRAPPIEMLADLAHPQILYRKHANF